MNILVDCFDRIGSSRINRQYKKHLLHKLDDQGKKVYLFGSEGRNINYEDTMPLNYRKKKVWDLLVEETLSLLKTYQINGLYLDNVI